MRTIWFLALALFVAGCGSSDGLKPPDLGGEDGKQIADLVEQLNDNGSRAKQLKGMFAAGAAVGSKDAKAFAQYQYGLKGKPTVTGSAATATVVVEKRSGGSPADKEWSFVKEGDKWKIKSAVLP